MFTKCTYVRYFSMYIFTKVSNMKLDFQSVQAFVIIKGDVSLMVRVCASGAGGRGFNPRPRHIKDLQNGTSGYLAWC